MKPEDDQTFTFGKHKGETVSKVMLYDPNYIVWASDNVSFFNIPLEVYEEAVARQTISKPRRRRYYGYTEDEDDWMEHPEDYF